MGVEVIPFLEGLEYLWSRSAPQPGCSWMQSRGGREGGRQARQQGNPWQGSHPLRALCQARRLKGALRSGAVVILSPL